MDLWMQIEGTKLEHWCARFLQICLQNASDCTYFSLDFQNFPGGGGYPRPPLKIPSFFSMSNSRLWYWSTDDFIEMPGFRNIMSRDRFMAILSLFHISDNTTAKPRGHPEHNRAHKIRPLFKKLVPLLQKHFQPRKELSVVESMIPFKGKTGLLIYMPAKPTRWALKAWGLADSKTGYMYNWQLYLGWENVQTPRAVGVVQVVTSLTEPLYNKGQAVYMDNFFASPALFEDLAQHQTGACGTLRVNRQGVPDHIKTARPHVGQPPITHTVGHIRYISWYDKRPVNLSTTVHSAQTYRKEVRSKRHQGHTREWTNHVLSSHTRSTWEV